MLHSLLVIAILITLHVQKYLCSPCISYSRPSGDIEFSESSYNYGHGRKHRQGCWEILTPLESFVILKFESLYTPSSDCSSTYVKITELGLTGLAKETVFCGQSVIQEPFVAFHNVRIEAFGREPSSFVLKYYIKSSTCSSEGAFHCSDKMCIPGHKVCDGSVDCSNGMDEELCKTGILSVEGVDVSLDKSYTWLENNVTGHFGWKNNLHRAIVALHLSGRTNFARKVTTPAHKLLIKQLKLETAVALLRNSTELVSVNKLSMLINAFLVTCHNPRYFYGFNLVQLLLDSIKSSEDPVQPIAYLALCNAKESLPKDDISQLLMVLAADTEYPFLPEIQAVAIMALSCILKNGQRDYFNGTDLEIYNDSIQQLKKLQNEDGSFGNVYTSALIVQALLSKGEENTKDWEMKKAILYLMNELKSKDFLSTYMILPILNRKSLASIADVNCTESLQHENGNPIDKISFKLGPKMRIQYSLYLGQKKDIIHTIFLTVSKNITAYETMEVAAVADPKYKFQSKSMSGKIYVFEINGYVNDPEEGLFWLTYITGSRFNNTLTHFKSSLDKIEIQEEDHLVMWYQPAQL